MPADAVKVLTYPARVVHDLCGILSRLDAIKYLLGESLMPPKGQTVTYREGQLTFTAAVNTWQQFLPPSSGRWGFIAGFTGGGIISTNPAPDPGLRHGFSATQTAALTFHRGAHHVLPTLAWYAAGQGSSAQINWIEWY